MILFVSPAIAMDPENQLCSKRAQNKLLKIHVQLGQGMYVEPSGLIVEYLTSAWGWNLSWIIM